MTVLEAALEALRRYQQSAQREESGDLSIAPSANCEKSEESEKRSVEMVEVACRCSRWPFPHLHPQEDRLRGVQAWNHDVKHGVDRIQ